MPSLQGLEEAKTSQQEETKSQETTLTTSGTTGTSQRKSRRLVKNSEKQAHLIEVKTKQEMLSKTDASLAVKHMPPALSKLHLIGNEAASSTVEWPSQADFNQWWTDSASLQMASLW